MKQKIFASIFLILFISLLSPIQTQGKVCNGCDGTKEGGPAKFEADLNPSELCPSVDQTKCLAVIAASADPNYITFSPPGGWAKANTPQGFVETIINKVIGYLLILALAIVPLLVIVGGYMMLASGGETAKRTTGKKIIIWAGIGLAIVLFAKAIESILFSVIF